jgi:hypothetical protein
MSGLTTRRCRLALLAGIAALGALAAATAAMAAGPIYLCLSEKAGVAKSGGLEGKCPANTAKVKYKKVALPSEESEQQTLLSLASHASYSESGVAGKPTIKFSGVNVQIVNGGGETSSLNGEGNLVIGYDETAREGPVQTGSHNLILGEENAFTSYGGIVSGYDSAITGEGASAISGYQDTASGADSFVASGELDTASYYLSAVFGGENNLASDQWATVTGGRENVSEGLNTSVTGGLKNSAVHNYAVVSGGAGNRAVETESWVGGGENNTANGAVSAIFGGKGLTTKSSYEAIP